MDPRFFGTTFWDTVGEIEVCRVRGRTKMATTEAIQRDMESLDIEY